MTEAVRIGTIRRMDSKPTPAPPYYAVIFASQRTEGDADAYAATAARMVELARAQAGFLGMESARGADGFGITVSYWSSLEAIAAWRQDAEHVAAQRLGRERWYRGYTLRVSRVEAETRFERAKDASSDGA